MTLNSTAHTEIVAKLLASRLNTRDFASMEDDDFGLSDKDSSYFEGGDVESFLEQTPNLLLWKTQK